MSEPKLKTCPFCGGDATIILERTYKRPDLIKYFAVCVNDACGANLESCYDREDAIATWNRRPA